MAESNSVLRARVSDPTMPIDVGTPAPQAMVDALVGAGIRFAVGMAGGTTVPVWSALDRNQQIHSVQVTEEAVATGLAEAAGRLSGRPIVVVGQGSWIAGQAGQGLIESLLGSSPMVVLAELSEGGESSHQSPYQGGGGEPGSWDAVGAFRAMCKSVYVAHTADQAVDQLRVAAAESMAGDPGPVAVLVRETAVSGRTEYSHTARVPARSRAAVAAVDLEQIAARVEHAQAPVLVAGNGLRVSGMCAELEALAERWNAMVVTTVAGKGVIDESHRLSAGVLGAFGGPVARNRLAAADLVVVLGSRLASSDIKPVGHEALERLDIVHIDIDPRILGRSTPVALAIVADLRDAMPQLLSATPQRAAIAPAKQNQVEDDTVVQHAVDVNGQWGVRAVVEAISQALPAGAVVCCDAGENRLFMLRWFVSAGGGHYLQPAAAGAMGSAATGALGAKLARPESAVIAVCGDGGFAMSWQALRTSVEMHLPFVLVVMDNQALGWVKHSTRSPVSSADRVPVDVVSVARAIGCDAVHVEDLEQLGSLIGNADGIDRPLVAHVRVSDDVTWRELVR